MPKKEESVVISLASVQVGFLSCTTTFDDTCEQNDEHWRLRYCPNLQACICSVTPPLLSLHSPTAQTTRTHLGNHRVPAHIASHRLV